MKIILLIVTAFFNLSVYAGVEKVKQIEVNARVIDINSASSKKMPQSTEIEPTSIYQTTVTIEHDGQLKHSCNKTHKHTFEPVREDK